MRNDCKWCYGEKEFLVYKKFEYKEGMYCQDCRKKSLMVLWTNISRV